MESQEKVERQAQAHDDWKGDLAPCLVHYLLASQTYFSQGKATGHYQVYDPRGLRDFNILHEIVFNPRSFSIYFDFYLVDVVRPTPHLEFWTQLLSALHSQRSSSILNILPNFWSARRRITS